MRHSRLLLPFLAAVSIAAAATAASPLLTAEEAVRRALEENHALSLARDEADLATLNRKTGIGPFLPTATASANHAGDLDGEADPRTTLGVSANVNLFTGFQSLFAYRRLRAQEAAAGLRERAAVEGTVEAVLNAYYGIAGQKLQIAALREALAVSEERARLARARFEVGAGSRLEMLQAQADLNADSSALLTRETALREAKIALNGLLARDPSEDFEVPDTIPLETALPLDAWRAALPETNADILEARAARRAADLQVTEARGARLPSLNGGLGYSTAPDALNPGTAAAGSDAVTYSLSLSLPLFDGLRTRQSVGASRYGLRRQETLLRQAGLEARSAFAEGEGRYAAGLRQAALEERNLEVAREQAAAARERYRVGAGTPLELRDAQQRLLDARGRLASARLTVKQSELALRRLAGALAGPAPGEN